MGEDGGLFATGQIRNDEAIAGERLKAETSTPVFNVRDEPVLLASPLSTALPNASRPGGVGVETDAERFIRPSCNATAEPPGRCVDEDFHEWDTNETFSGVLKSQDIEI
jgi:hypothetical protein